jgi:hypothetical protein
MNSKLIILLGALALPLPAMAGILTVNSPEVEQGKSVIEAGAKWEVDHRKSRDNVKEYALEYKYGLTDYWAPEIEFLAGRESGKGTFYKLTALENTFQFLKQSAGAPLSVGLRVNYEAAYQTGDADVLAARLLLRYTHENWELRANIGGSREVGKNASNGVGGDIRSSVRYHLSEHLTPAINYFGKTGRLDDMPGYSLQSHRIGPALYAKLCDEVNVKFAYLVGISSAAPDNTFKLGIEYSF